MWIESYEFADANRMKRYAKKHRREYVSCLANLADVIAALNNGAAVEFDDNTHPNALFRAVWYICADGSIQDTDIDLLRLLIDHGASITESNSSYTPSEFLQMAAGQYNISDKDSGLTKAKNLLTQ